ncbi:hypothetical protein BDN72DRAFT_849814 [Pluteus cervinus]|uniref:Uncharacterized protein n=1 Tax=Pluteus cervinus TaxID=181527 RepID=A0ACD3A6F1_9AGAR|nr:hypothetical protein BDN72DRAFT_849814 [Pluteus cervinus]
MSSSTPLSGPSTTTASLKFSTEPPNGDRAYVHINADAATGKQNKNTATGDHNIVIENIRGQEHLYNLDTAGFQIGHHPANHKTFTNDVDVENEYYPESIDLIKKVTGASKVVLFDHTIRRRRPGEIDSNPQKRQPVSLAHVDQTKKAAIARVHRHLPPSEAPSLLEKRFQIINLWRPINNPAVDWPLSLCDYRSVDPAKDVFPVALIYPDREGETMAVKYNPDQKWKYFYGVAPEEYILIKCFDSLQDGSVSLFTPHTGFEDPATPPGAPLRESIELRALVFYD